MTNKLRLAALCALSLTALSPAAFAANQTLPDPLPAPDEALRPYYAALAAQTSLPVAGPGARLDPSREISRIAFASCYDQTRPRDMWARIMAQKPDSFLFIGDNVYGDPAWDGGASLQSLRDAYAALAAQSEFQAFRAVVPMMAMWDDHDFGLNDSGAAFPFREWSETIFETFWGSRPEVRARPGVYDSVIAGPKGRRVQIVMLDTRFDRSPLKRGPATFPRPPLGPYVPDDAPGARFMSAAQWQWLEQELARPAEVRIVVSSIQILSGAHGFETWANFPRERARLLDMIDRRAGGTVVLLSGDRHAAALYEDRLGDTGETIHEITSSALNMTMNSVAGTEREPDRLRTTEFYGGENFGLVEIDWKQRSLKLGIQSKSGWTVFERTVPLAR